MIAPDPGPPPRRHESLVFEVTQRCNYRCPHCYNVWHLSSGYLCGELPTDRTLAMLGKLLDESGASLVSLSGGEPLLRSDLGDIVDFLVSLRVSVNLLTNGALLDDRALSRLTSGKIAVFELPLLSADRAVHDDLCGASGAFDKATAAVAALKLAGQCVVCVFVATRLNLHTWRQTAELAVALGADGILFDRFNPGGRGAAHITRLQAGPAELKKALDIAQEVSERYGVPINCSIPMPPCLFDQTRWPKLGFGFCAAGTARAYYAD